MSRFPGVRLRKMRRRCVEDRRSVEDSYTPKPRRKNRRKTEKVGGRVGRVERKETTVVSAPVFVTALLSEVPPAYVIDRMPH